MEGSAHATRRNAATTSLVDTHNGQCIAWCRDGKCKKTDATISFDCARYEHKDEHKGKFPSATYPPKRSGRK